MSYLWSNLAVISLTSVMEVLSLTSETHATQFIQTFGELFKDNVLTDVTLVCDDQVRVDAHKIVLSAGSHFFREMFVNNPHSHPLLYLRGLKEPELLSILQFLYLGETSLNKDSVPQFLSVARELEISGLEKQETGAVKTNEPEAETIEEEQKIKIKTPEPSQKQADTTLVAVKDSTVVSRKKKPSYSCDKCKYEAPSSLELKRHQTTCVVPSPSVTKELPRKPGVQNYPCDCCNFQAQSKYKLAEHKVAVHAVSCSQCNTKFQSEAAMLKHRRAKHEDPTALKVPEQKLACHQCRFVSSRMDLLREHVINTHPRAVK